MNSALRVEFLRWSVRLRWRGWPGRALQSGNHGKTTASPARAASTEALRAKRLVWKAIWPMLSTCARGVVAG